MKKFIYMMFWRRESNRWFTLINDDDAYKKWQYALKQYQLFAIEYTKSN